ncbi:hypothetical protein BU16DRAFT_621996 [Lophium mytilinum]|uniref:RRM domain-containing protein n=1 Tax=Lophium mytilinum TaxID=390894 RepID=A0A6A6QFH7_9PEZI|nr:hypothetical protein BU16DRAFT_621996 [Lophium mytilinum]
MVRSTPVPSSPIMESSPQGSSGTGPTEYSPVTERVRGKQPVKDEVTDTFVPTKASASTQASASTPASASVQASASTRASASTPRVVASASSSSGSYHVVGRNIVDIGDLVRKAVDQVTLPPVLPAHQVLRLRTDKQHSLTTSSLDDIDAFCTRHLLIDLQQCPSFAADILKWALHRDVIGEPGSGHYITESADSLVILIDADDLALTLRVREVILRLMFDACSNLDAFTGNNLEFLTGIHLEFLQPAGASQLRYQLQSISSPATRVAFEVQMFKAQMFEAQVFVQVRCMSLPGVQPREFLDFTNEVSNALTTKHFARYGHVFHALLDHNQVPQGYERLRAGLEDFMYRVEFDSVKAARDLAYAWAENAAWAELSGRQNFPGRGNPVSWEIVNVGLVDMHHGDFAHPFPLESGSSQQVSPGHVNVDRRQGNFARHSGHGNDGLYDRGYARFQDARFQEFADANAHVVRHVLPVQHVYPVQRRGFRPGYRNGRTWNAHDNTVSYAHILDGSDVRTTIMLRNIPNKMTDEQLLLLLWDAGFRGLIDFMYLRMDFKSGANVGYAFFNLTSPIHIIRFLECFEGRPWPSMRAGPTTKLAEISYATSQGLEALIQKFRNSSVMRELKSCRPKLFYTFQDNVPIQLVGGEVDFPAPDNEQKLERSIQNAQSIGLFPPNGRGGASPNRRDRMSMFDRGTPRDLAAAYNVQGYGPISPAQFQYPNGHHSFY